MIDTKKTLTSYSLDDAKALMQELGQPAFRAEQLFSWIQKGATVDEMTNLPKDLREKLKLIPFGGVEIITRLTSKKDGTVKYLYKLEDGNIIEGVLMQYSYGRTICISTQVGCNMGCAFCASTLEGCVRNLTPGEMLYEILSVERELQKEDKQDRAITNVVLMGSGEPLDNYDNTIAFLKLVSHPKGINISPRNISLSTCGIPSKIIRLIEEAPHVTLSISLHAPFNNMRSELMPINRVYPLNDVLEAAKLYAEKTGRRVIFEYALISGVNDTKECATQLSRITRGINCHVNLIPLNTVKERNLIGATRKKANEFLVMLKNLGVSATIRREMGSDIEGACGQLRRRVIKEGEFLD
jgi:23S rRNA (adenine2503-C2)-methyltransferase